MIRMIPLAAVTLAALALLTPAAAQETGAHVHGRAQIAVVREGSVVTVELRSPLYNLLGFERAPAAGAETQAWKAAASAAANPDRLFTLDPAAGCRLRTATTGVLGGPIPSAAGASSHGHDSHDHGDGHDHAGLSDAVLVYAFDCANPSKLSRIRVQAFGAFRHLEGVDLVYLDGARQNAKKLTARDAEFRIRKE